MLSTAPLKRMKYVRSAQLARARSPVDGVPSTREHLRTRNSASRPSVAGAFAPAPEPKYVFRRGSGASQKKRDRPVHGGDPFLVSTVHFAANFDKTVGTTRLATVHFPSSVDQPRFRVLKTRSRLGPEGRAACRLWPLIGVGGRG